MEDKYGRFGGGRCFYQQGKTREDGCSEFL